MCKVIITMLTPDNKNHEIIREILRLKNGVERSYDINIAVEISYAETKQKLIPFEEFTERLCDLLQVTWEQIKNLDRRSYIAEARFIYIYLRKKYYGHSLASIARDLNRDHSSMIHAISTVKDRIETNEFPFVLKLNQAEEMFQVVEVEEAALC